MKEEKTLEERAAELLRRQRLSVKHNKDWLTAALKAVQDEQKERDALLLNREAGVWVNDGPPLSRHDVAILMDQWTTLCQEAIRSQGEVCGSSAALGFTVGSALVP